MFDENRRPQVHEQGSSSALFGFALGLVAGAGLALFMAPATGRDTRQALREKGRRLATDAADRGLGLLKRQGERVSSVVERGYEKAAELGDRVNDAVDQGKATYRAAKDRANTAASGIASAAEDLSSHETRNYA